MSSFVSEAAAGDIVLAGAARLFSNVLLIMVIPSTPPNANESQLLALQQAQNNDIGSDIPSQASNSAPGAYLEVGASQSGTTSGSYTQINLGRLLGSSSIVQQNSSNQVLSVTSSYNPDGSKASDTAALYDGSGTQVADTNLSYQSGQSANPLSFSVNGTAVEATGGDGIAVTVNGQAATIRLGNGANLRDNTSGSIDTTGGNSQVNIKPSLWIPTRTT